MGFYVSDAEHYVGTMYHSLGGFSNVWHYDFMFLWNRKKRIYLDYASATSVRPEVVSAMLPYFNAHYGNAGSIHQEGVCAKRALEDSRETLARVLRVRPSGIVFTGSGTESNNLALRGVIETERAKGRAYADMEIVASHIEHASVTEVLAHLQQLGVIIRYVPTNSLGIIEHLTFTEALHKNTVLVVLGYVNSEIGVVEHIGKLVRTVRVKERELEAHIHVHVDAAQAPLWLPCALDALLVDTLTLDAGKCYGPKGVGVVVMRHSVHLAPYFFGGSQEFGLRSGTENVPLIVGAVRALVLAQEHHVVRAQQVTLLRDAFITMLLSIDGVEVNGSQEDRVANNVNISIRGIDSEFAVISLDAKGIACATKSACGGARGDGSAVVRAITGDAARALSTLRFTLGEETTYRELQYTARALQEHVTHIRTSMEALTKK